MLIVGKPQLEMDLSEYSRIKVWPFLSRVLFYLVLVAGCIAVIVRTGAMPSFLAMIVLGLVYAHGVELQHQALHNTGFPSKRWNRFVGFFLGLPMLVSFSDYQHSHLRHHRLLSTADDREFFNYGYDRLTSLKPLLRHLLMASHYGDVTRFVASSLCGRRKPDMKPETARKIRSEYQWMALALATAIAVSLYFRTALLLEIWLVPLLFAVPAHALIELPEHWGRDHGVRDVRKNTRTIGASRFAYWYTNGNNYHIEHHWLPSVPNDRLAALHQRIAADIEIDSYPSFYRRFFAELFRNTFPPRNQGGESAAL